MDNLLNKILNIAPEQNHTVKDRHIAVAFRDKKVYAYGINGTPRHAEKTLIKSVLCMTGQLGILQQYRQLWGVKQPQWEKSTKEYSTTTWEATYNCCQDQQRTIAHVQAM